MEASLDYNKFQGSLDCTTISRGSACTHFCGRQKKQHGAKANAEMQLLFLRLWVLLTLGRLMASTGIPRVLLTSGNLCLFVIPEGKLLISISGMLASTAFEGILSMSVFRVSLRKISCIFNVTQNASVKFWAFHFALRGS